MKVMVISHSYVVEENFKNILALSALADVQVIVPDQTGDMFAGTQRAEVQHHPQARVFKRLSLPRQQYVLFSADLGMRAFKPDIINVEYDPWCPIFWQAWLYRKLFAPDAKLVATVKKNTFRRARFPFQQLKGIVFRVLSGSVSKFIAINRGVARIYHTQLDVSAERIVTMQHLGTDTDLFHPAPEKRAAQGAFVIGYAGRLAEHKGVPELVEACRRLSAAGRNIELRLLGGGAFEPALRATGHDWLTFFPPVRHEQVAGFLQGLDLFVMPARITPDHEEHDGHAVMEALACGVPCLGSNSGVLPELVSADEGYLFEANNVDDLSEKLEHIIDNPHQHTTLGEADRARAVSRFSIDRIARDRFQLYESLLK